MVSSGMMCIDDELAKSGVLRGAWRASAADAIGDHTLPPAPEATTEPRQSALGHLSPLTSLLSPFTSAITPITAHRSPRAGQCAPSTPRRRHAAVDARDVAMRSAHVSMRRGASIGFVR